MKTTFNYTTTNPDFDTSGMLNPVRLLTAVLQRPRQLAAVSDWSELPAPGSGACQSWLLLGGNYHVLGALIPYSLVVLSP